MRALEGTYSHLYKQLIDQPRVFSSKDVPWKGGPGHYGKSVISPQAVNITQSIESHIEAYAPGASGQKHGHLNSAVFYVLKGRGHDVHDGRHIPWKAGDVMLVENACVHQHFNDDPKEEAILLVFKAKPLFLFMHLLFQKIVEWPSKIPPKGAENYNRRRHPPHADHLLRRREPDKPHDEQRNSCSPIASRRCPATRPARSAPTR